MVQEYIKNNQDWLSPEAIELLEHLARNIKHATGNNFRDMKSANELWLTKDFAGMINLSFAHKSDTVRLDVLPVVTTTSSASKILTGQGRPTILKRGQNEASEQEKRISKEYQQKVMNIIDKNFSSLLVD